MLEENEKQHWLKIGAIALITFICAFLAFYIVMEIMINRISNPTYQVKKLEKLIAKQERDFERFDERRMENPFEPRMRPMLVNLVKEPSEYKIIVDLKPLDNDEKGISVNIDNNILTVNGEIDKKLHGNEKIIRFSQTYYLDEELEKEKMTQEKKNDKYIITIPFENKD